MTEFNEQVTEFIPVPKPELKTLTAQRVGGLTGHIEFVNEYINPPAAQFVNNTFNFSFPINTLGMPEFDPSDLPNILLSINQTLKFIKLNSVSRTDPYINFRGRELSAAHRSNIKFFMDYENRFVVPVITIPNSHYRWRFGTLFIDKFNVTLAEFPSFNAYIRNRLTGLSKNEGTYFGDSWRASHFFSEQRYNTLELIRRPLLYIKDRPSPFR